MTIIPFLLHSPSHSALKQISDTNTSSIMKLQHLFQLYILCQLILLLAACTKQDEWLDIKRQNTDVTPRTLNDFDDMLHNTNIFNQGYGIYGLTGTDNL